VSVPRPPATKRGRPGWHQIGARSVPFGT